MSWKVGKSKVLVRKIMEVAYGIILRVMASKDGKSFQSVVILFIYLFGINFCMSVQLDWCVIV